MTNEFNRMNKEMESKTEKFAFFEKKLNKWVKLFEESDEINVNRHNEIVAKIKEVDTA